MVCRQFQEIWYVVFENLGKLYLNITYLLVKCGPLICWDLIRELVSNLTSTLMLHLISLFLNLDFIRSSHLMFDVGLRCLNSH